MFSSPTLVDLDADGKMEIIVGTSVGFVYVLDHKVGVLCVCREVGCGGEGRGGGRVVAEMEVGRGVLMCAWACGSGVGWVVWEAHY
jgi:hypothetical protein